MERLFKTNYAEKYIQNRQFNSQFDIEVVSIMETRTAIKIASLQATLNALEDVGKAHVNLYVQTKLKLNDLLLEYGLIQPEAPVQVSTEEMLNNLRSITTNAAEPKKSGKKVSEATT